MEVVYFQPAFWCIITSEHIKRKNSAMVVFSVYDNEFASYGQVHYGYDTTKLVEAMNRIEMPASGTAYEPGIASLEELEIFEQFENRGFGGMPIQLGMCWGHNTKLNCLEYHRDSELNIGTTDYILLLCKKNRVRNGVVDSSKVQAFKVPAGVVVEVYATSLHYAPCQVNEEGFRVAVVLPKGTNTEKPDFAPVSAEDKWMTARNKWLLAHIDSAEARNGAHVGITGENLDVTK